MNLVYYATTYENNRKEQIRGSVPFVADTDRENELINLYPQIRYQEIEGFGGAITDSAGYVYSLMRKEQKEEMIKQYFGKEKMKYSMVRIPIDSCDFSLEHYEADSLEEDASFAHFSFERIEKYILPLLDAAEKEYGGRLPIMLSPWSPPAYMKTNQERNNGGRLKKEYRKRWAEYICRYIQEYQSRGYLVTKLTLQNEPKAVQTWDSCVYTPSEQKEFLRDYMWPALQRHGLEEIKIYIWDHNKERAFEWVEEMIDESTSAMIEGVAFHWYSGDHFEALQMIHEIFPEKKLMLSEACIEYSKFGADDYLKNAQKYAHDIIGNLNHGMHTFLDWNLVLDEKGGPNHVKNYCDAPYLFHTKDCVLTESNLLSYIWHFSHFLEPGAVRIGVSGYSDKLEVTAFETDGKLIVIILNRTKEDIPAYIRIKDECAGILVKSNSIISSIIQ